jgi:long-chain-fatty-acid--[acyl-carrier-protein] ligase
MLRLLRFLLFLVNRALLRLRYRVRVHGLDKLGEIEGPVLILPNHPGFIDPPLVLTALESRFHPRPLLFADNFRNPVLAPVSKILDALEVPDLDRASRRARKQAEQAVRTLIAGLKAGRSHVMWPAGRAQRAGKEVLGGARALSDILKACPEVTVLLVRTRGVFGSMFSYAQTGKPPSLGRNFLKAIGLILASLIFFMPRRRVDITVEKLDRSQLPENLDDRRAVNKWFEDWYNKDGPEAPTWRPYHFLFGRRDHKWPEPDAAAGVDLAKITPEVRNEVNEMLARKLKRQLSDADLRPEVTFDELGLDSLDRMDLTQRVEQRFGFTGDDVPQNLGQLWALAQGLASKGPPRPTPPLWFRPPSDSGPPTYLGETIASAFVERALTCRKDVAVADDLSGALTYERLLVGALSVAGPLSQLPGANVGLLLPASVGCDVAFLGLHLAGKLPVVLNWTTGQVHMEHAARTMGLTHVVTSEAFLDRADLADIPGVEWVYLEDLRKTSGKLRLLLRLLRVRWRPGSVRGAVPKADPHSPAVVLFTSGSEKAPKAVPLTHHNLLSDMRASIQALGVTRADAMLGFLPAFHSFGMSVTGLLPLLGGMKVVRHADPTDAGGLARKAAAYRPTVLCATPTFVSFILAHAGKGQLASLKYLIVGAEKCPEDLFARTKEAAPDGLLLEGYGITECSPVVSVNTPKANRPGTIGRPLPGVSVCVVEVEGERELPTGEQGMLLVSGPTIFPGYIGYDGPSPFVERGGKRWYVTGDLAKIDADGFIHFAGRLKRFLKAGGEMISLPALEEPLAQKWRPDKDGPLVAVEGVEQPGGGRRIVLFSRVPIALGEANDVLEVAGFRGVMRLTETRQVPSIPVLGTGKTDYKQLRAQLTEGVA